MTMSTKTAAPTTAAEKTAAANELFNNKTKNLAAKPSTTLQSIPLSLISVSYNVRRVFPALADMGHEYIKLLKMAIGTEEEKAEFCALIEEHEAYRYDAGQEDDQTFMELAESLFDHGQLQPILARQLGSTDNKNTKGEVVGKKYGYAIVAGGRRTGALAYLYAKGLQSVMSVKAELVTGTKRELMEKSIAENTQRKDFTQREMGEIVNAYRVEDKLSWPDISKKLHRSVPYLQGCYSLVNPTGEAPPDVLEKLERGEIKRSEAVKIAQGKAKLDDTGKVVPTALGDGGTRLTSGAPQRSLPVSKIKDLIDATPLDNSKSNVARITAFSEAIGSTYEVESEASQARREKVLADAKAESEAEEAAKAEKKGSKKGSK
jgi:ParB-like chromosome segregation protein Spo0J